jgi:hypothetical protein
MNMPKLSKTGDAMNESFLVGLILGLFSCAAIVDPFRAFAFVIGASLVATALLHAWRARRHTALQRSMCRLIVEQDNLLEVLRKGKAHAIPTSNR